MKIGVASDHRGYEKKQKVIKYLLSKGIEVADYGTNSKESCDYPIFAELVCDAILKEEIDKGILICGTGIGMSIVANKRKGIMCAKVDNYKEAALAREHNHANIISFSEKKSMMEVKDMLDAYLKTSELNDEKYLRRIEIIKQIESKRK